MSAGWQDSLISWLDEAERLLLAGLHAAGIVADTHGQPAWPFAKRVAIETLALDPGLCRDLAWLFAGLGVVLVLLLAAFAWRGRRAFFFGLALVLASAMAWLRPWPSLELLLADAVPTSFHRAPDGFQSDSIEQGLAVFQQRCASCHGVDGRGEVALAARLPVWPPRLNGELLWRRPEGEVFGRILYGMHDRQGRATMPGFAGQIDDEQAWAVMDAMKALAAGSSVRTEGSWSEPVKVPDARVRCADGRPAQGLSALHGQRVRIVASSASAGLVREDPRLLTVELPASGAAPRYECWIDQPNAASALAQVSGISDGRTPPGAQWIVDRDGWLRAFGAAGKDAWSRSDLLCSADPRQAPLGETPARRPGDGLGELIAAMDAEPIRIDAIGPAHGP